MTRDAVQTFELVGSGALLQGGASDMSAASLALPQGAYTSLRTYGGRRVLRLGQHLRRLEESVALQGRPGAIDGVAARHGLAAVLDACGHAESRLRLTFAPPRLFASAQAFAPPEAAAILEGVACVTVPVHRANPHAKDTRFIAVAGQAYRSLPPGIHEGLMVAADGSVLEGLSSNVFAVLRGVLRTEQERALLGVTRSLVLEVAAAVLPIVETAVSRDDLAAADECFITSVSREVMPVVRIDGRDVGDGRPGPMTREIIRRFAELVEREAETLVD
jgi:branched-chain amino acid aminotransferase